MSSDEDFNMETTDLLSLLFEDGHIEDDVFADGARLMQEWGLSEQDMINDNETEEFLNSILGPFEEDMKPVHSWSPMGSDSGISEDNNNCHSPSSSDITLSPNVKFPDQADSPEFQTAYVYDIIQSDHNYSLQEGAEDNDCILHSVRTEEPEIDVSIDLEDWNPDDIAEDEFADNPVTLSIEDVAHSGGSYQFKELILTEEEKRILAKEGAVLPSHMPLTKVEERLLKRVRRKIRNKQSAQESRKKKKQYVDGLESRVTACTIQNQELQKKVQQLQKQNMTLIEQLRKLQALVKQTTMKTTTASTCIMVFLLSFCLIVFPSVNPFGTTNIQKGLYTTSGVVSRNLRSINTAETLNQYEQPKISKYTSDENVNVLLEAEIDKPVITGGQNLTPEIHKVEKAESESAVNSNSSSDFPSQAKSAVIPEVDPNSQYSSGEKGVNYKVNSPAVTKDDWTDHKPTTVIIQQHHSDEM
uniref:Cyclic AMP-responsive element-binding protein 3-like protein 3 n=1 Tax=Erpetoichthys calabaricus TaxID=27687 RepID=A0A8C4S1M5_ERPCA